MTTRLIIARHGNTFAPGDCVTRLGKTDLPLVESGLLQGRRLGFYLQQQQLIPDVIFASELKRTQQTAEQAIEVMQLNRTINRLSIFNEIDYGVDENQPEEQVVARLGAKALQAWESSAIVPEGWKVEPQQIIKNWNIFAQRLQQDYAGKTILVVTSNGIARFAPYLTGDFDAFSAKHPIKIATGALCIFTKAAQDECWLCLQWNVKPPAAL